MVLDHLDGLELAEAEVDDHFDARMALGRLGEGLLWLYQSVMKLEQTARTRAARENVQLAIMGGIVAGLPAGVLSCAFQWYAVSACNYAQLVGWLATRDSAAAKAYLTRVLPRLSQYRNKVAAHLAIADPRRDNEADLAASVMTHVVYARGRLRAAALTPVVKIDGTDVGVSQDLSWSLTLVHERLIPRYWPGGPPKAYSSIRVPPGRTTLNLSWSDLLGDDSPPTTEAGSQADDELPRLKRRR